jgi:hypothetical protein
VGVFNDVQLCLTLAQDDLIRYNPQTGLEKHVVTERRPLKSLLDLTLPDHRVYAPKLAAITNGRPLSDLQLFHHACW